MLYTRTVGEHQDGTVTAILPVAVGSGGRDDDFMNRRDRLAAEHAIDEVLADSFPASDPPSWNSGVAQPDVIGHFADQESANIPISDAGDGGTAVGDAIDVSDQRTHATRTPEQ